MIKSLKSVEFLPVIAIAICLFIGNYYMAGGVLFGTLFLSLAFFKNRLTFKIEDLAFFLYFLMSTLVYLYLGEDQNDYIQIVFFPFIIYIVASTMKTDHLRAAQLLLGVVIFYSLLTFFRDESGNLSFSLANNVYMHERVIEESVQGNRFFRNATAVALWPLTALVLALCLFNFTKSWPYLVIALACFVLLFLTNSRLTLATAIVIIIISLLIHKQRLILLLVILAVPILYFIVTSLGTAYQGQVERLSELTDKNEEYGLGYRADFWRYSLKLVSENMWGYGHRYVLTHIGRSVHNEFLGQAVSVGVIAAVLYFFFLIYSAVKRLRNLIKFKNASLWNEIAFFLILVYFINGMTEQISVANKVWLAVLFLAIGWSKQIQPKPRLVI